MRKKGEIGDHRIRLYGNLYWAGEARRGHHDHISNFSQKVWQVLVSKGRASRKRSNSK